MGYSTDAVRIPIVIDDTPIAPGLASLGAKMRDMKYAVKDVTQPFDDFKKITTGLGHVMFPLTLAIGAGVGAFAALASKSPEVKEQADRLSESWGQLLTAIGGTSAVGGTAKNMLITLGGALDRVTNSIASNSVASINAEITALELRKKMGEQLTAAENDNLKKLNVKLLLHQGDLAKLHTSGPLLGSKEWLAEQESIDKLRESYKNYISETSMALQGKVGKVDELYARETAALGVELKKRAINEKEYNDGVLLAQRKRSSALSAISDEADKQERDRIGKLDKAYSDYMYSSEASLASKEEQAILSYQKELDALRATGLDKQRLDEAELLGKQALYKKIEEIQADTAKREKEEADKRRTNLQKYADEAKDTFKQVDAATVSAMRGMEDAFVNAARTGSLSFTAFADSVINDLIRIQVRQSIVGPLANAMAAYFGGGDTASATGPAPSSSIGGYTPVAMTDYGGGGALQGPKSKAAAPSAGGGNVVINVTNNSSTPVQAKSGGAQFDGKAWIVSVVLENIDQGGGIYKAVKGVAKQ